MEVTWGQIWRVLALAAIYTAMYHLLTQAMNWGSSKSSYDVQKTQFIAWLVFSFAIFIAFMYFNRRHCTCK